MAEQYNVFMNYSRNDLEAATNLLGLLEKVYHKALERRGGGFSRIHGD